VRGDELASHKYLHLIEPRSLTVVFVCQAMRDVPISGGHPDVITALYFLDAHQLLLSADDSGNIMAWFVRPSRWKGQLAFQLHTPAATKDAQPSTALSLPAPTLKQQSTSNKSEAPNTDPIRLVNAISKFVHNAVDRPS
jgi:hypothetical protein